MNSLQEKQAIRRSYKADLLHPPYDAIVIGSGIGGLASAALLAQAGKKVLVLERHYVAGGFTHSYSRKGYEWDVGIHYIGEVHRENSVLRKVFDSITERRLDWAPMGDVYDKICIGNPAEIYDYVAGGKNFIERMIRYFPEEEQAIRDYIHLVYELAHSARSFFAAKALPSFLSAPLGPFMRKDFTKLSDKTTLQVLQSLTSNKKLIGVLAAQYGDYGLPPSQSSFAIHAMVAKHYLDGGNYPIGGAGRIATTIAPVIEKAGGSIFVRAEVERVLVRNRRAYGVTLSNGDEIEAPIVISDAGVMNTFGKLFSSEDKQILGVEEKLKTVQPSLSHIGLYLGMKESSAALQLPKYNYWIYPSYDHDETIRNYSHHPESPLPVTYVSFPSAKDPDWENRFPGKSTIEVVGFAPYEWFQAWENKPWMKRGEDYDALKKGIADRLMEEVYRFVPQIRGKIDHMEISTPLSTRTFCNYDKGEIYGIDHTPERFRLKWLKPQTPLKGFYLTGQDIVSDGIGGALMAGVLTASAILKKNLIKDMYKSK